MLGALLAIEAWNTYRKKPITEREVRHQSNGPPAGRALTNVQPHRLPGSIEERYLSGARRPIADVPCVQRTPPPTGKPTGPPLMQREGPLPTLGVKVGSAKGAASGIRCDPLATLGAITGMHNSEDLAKPSQADKEIVRGSEEPSWCVQSMLPSDRISAATAGFSRLAPAP